jgi:hypothetical protein
MYSPLGRRCRPNGEYILVTGGVAAHRAVRGDKRVFASSVCAVALEPEQGDRKVQGFALETEKCTGFWRLCRQKPVHFLCGAAQPRHMPLLKATLQSPWSQRIRQLL